LALISCIYHGQGKDENVHNICVQWYYLCWMSLTSPFSVTSVAQRKGLPLFELAQHLLNFVLTRASGN